MHLLFILKVIILLCRAFYFMYTSIEKLNELKGLKFGEWTIIEFVRVGVEHQKIVKVKCSCGKIKDVYLSTIKSGASKSCGCKIKRKIKHGLSKSKLYGVWNGMKHRCYNTNFRQYKDYGGRGIQIDPIWRKDFNSFKYWAIRNGYKNGLELDRINNNKDYCSTNCRWVTHTENNRNKRDNRWVEFNSEKRLLIELCEIYSMNYKTVENRIKRGWTVEDSLSTPINKKPL